MQSKFIGAFEAKTHFSELLEKVENGEIIVITKHGRAVARLSPFNVNKATPEEVIDELKQFQFTKKLSLSGLNWKGLRDKGRK